MHHYVYYSYEEWGRGYIGVRSCHCSPEDDCKYFGSFYDKTFKPTNKIILTIFKNKEEAIAAEIALHSFYQVHVNSHFANQSKQTSHKFYNGEHSEETKLKISRANKGKTRSRELKKRWSEQRKGRKKGPFSEQHKANMSKAKSGDNSPVKGRRWWNDGADEIMTYECPGEGWTQGRSPATIKKCSENSKRQHEKRRESGLPWPPEKVR